MSYEDTLVSAHFPTKGDIEANEVMILQFELEAPDDFTIYSFVQKKMLTKTEMLDEMKHGTITGQGLIEVFKLGFNGSTKHYKPKP